MPSREASADQQFRAPISLAEQVPTGGPPQPGQTGLSGRQPAVPAPAPASMITPSPTDVDSIPIESSQYALIFTVSASGMPNEDEKVEASEVTRNFLEQFMSNEFSRMPLSILDDFVTRRVASSYSMGRIVGEFTSTARFEPGSLLPEGVQIDEALAMAFKDGDLALYISYLNALPSSNVFSSTTSVTFSLGSTLQVSNSARKSNGASGAGIAAGAVAATLLLAGFVIYKRRANEEQEESKGAKKTDGAATVAGDTYSGETVSIAASSLDYGGSRYRDEETGGIHHLEAIREIYDDSSVTPAWDEGSMNDQDQDEACAQAKKSNEEDASEEEGTVESYEENNSGTEEVSTMSGSTASSSQSDAEDRSDSYRDPYLHGTSNGAKSFDGTERSASSDLTSQMGDGEDTVEGTEQPLQAEKVSRSIEEGEEGADDVSHGNGSIEGQFVSIDLRKEPRSTSSAEIGSLLSHDLDYLQEIEQEPEEQEPEEMLLKKVDDSYVRPRTVSEIEILLSADLGDDVSQYDDVSHYTESGFDDEFVPADDCSTPSQRPRTVSEIESLLSADVDDDVQMV